MKEKHIFWLIISFIVYMHFEGFLKLFFNFHPVMRSFKFVFSLLFLAIVIFKTKIPKTNLNLPVLIFCIFVFLQFFNPLMWKGYGLLLSIAGMFFQIAFVPLFFVSYKILDIDRLKKILYLILILATLSALFAHLQFYIGPGEYLRIMPYSLESKQMIGGFAGRGPIAFDVIPPSLWYLTGIIISLIFLFSSKRKIAYLLLSFNCLIALFLTGYRSGLLVSLLSFFIIVIFNFNIIKKKNIFRGLVRVLFILLIILIFLFPFLSEGNKQKYSTLVNPVGVYIRERGFTWKVLIDNSLRYPFGVGLRSGQRVDETKFGVIKSPIYMGDNYFLMIAGELGFFALITLFWLYLVIIRRFVSNFYKLEGFKKFVNICLFALLFGLMISSGFIGNPNSWMFWLFSGVLFKLDKIEEKRKLDIIKRKGKTNKIGLILSNSFFIKKLFNFLKERKYNYEWIQESFIVRIPLKLYLFSKHSIVFKFFDRLFKSFFE